jgi:hypothetical protein
MKMGTYAMEQEILDGTVMAVVFQNQENGFAVYQILARYLAKHN